MGRRYICKKCVRERKKRERGEKKKKSKVTKEIIKHRELRKQKQKQKRLKGRRKTGGSLCKQKQDELKKNDRMWSVENTKKPK